MSSTALPRLHPACTSPDDAVDLVARAQAGDRAAFEALYRRHVGRIHALCLRLCADGDLAEQLTQDAFVRAWRQLPGFQGRSAFGTWLHRVAVNAVVDRQRALARRRSHETVLDPTERPDLAEAPSTASPGRIIDRLALERAIAGLPEGARTVFVLHEVEGYRVREVADLLGLADGTVKAQLFRARRLLREVLR